MRITILLIWLAVSITAFAQEEEKTDSVAVKESENVEPTEEIKDSPNVEKENIKEEANDYDRDEAFYRKGKRHHHHRNDQNRIHTLSRHSYHSGGFGSIAFKWGDFQGQTTVLAGVRGGWIINRAVAIGFEGYGIIPTAEFENILLLQDVVLLGGYGGMFLEPILFSNQIVHVTFPVSAGAGWLGYHRDFEDNFNTIDDDLIDDDIFWYLEPGVTVEVNVSRHFRIAVGASRRYTEDLELLNTPEKAFEGTNYSIALKLGRF